MNIRHVSCGVLVALTIGSASAVAHADYPPVPSDLGRRVETRELVPAAIATRAAVAVKAETVAVVIQPKPSLVRVTVRARDITTGRVTTRVIQVPTGSRNVTASLGLAGGTYRVQVIGQLRNGRQVKWDAGRQTVRARSRR